jgi:hypothetical protein
MTFHNRKNYAFNMLGSQLVGRHPRSRMETFSLCGHDNQRYRSPCQHFPEHRPPKGSDRDIHPTLLQNNLEMLLGDFTLPLTHSLIVYHCYISLCYPEQCYLLYKYMNIIYVPTCGTSATRPLISHSERFPSFQLVVSLRYFQYLRNC